MGRNKKLNTVEDKKAAKRLANLKYYNKNHENIKKYERQKYKDNKNIFS